MVEVDRPRRCTILDHDLIGNSSDLSEPLLGLFDRVDRWEPVVEVDHELTRDDVVRDATLRLRHGEHFAVLKTADVHKLRLPLVHRAEPLPGFRNGVLSHPRSSRVRR
jgi:hypothetical protein